MARAARVPIRGRLTSIVNIQSRKRTRTPHGGASSAWTTDDEGTRRARIEHVAGGEGSVNNALTADATHLVTLDYVANLTSQKRFLLPDGRLLNISLVRNVDNRNIVQVCECKENVK